MNRLRTWFVATSAAVLAVCALPGGAGAATPTDPRQDPFYAVPSDISAYAPGAVIASRPVTAAAFGAFKLNVTAWQVKYRTTDNLGHATATLTTIMVPSTAAPLAGKPRPVVSYQTAEDSNSLQCAPSYGLVSGAPVDNPASQAETVIMAGYLAKGDVVVVPDYEGPNSLYTEGTMAGQATLDGIRAAKRFSPAGIDRQAPVAITGYSGGALATEWAAQLQPSYAPDVRLSAVAAGGVPVNIEHIAEHITYGSDAGALDGIVLNGITGEYNAHPELSGTASSFITTKGYQIINDLSTHCAGQALNYAFTPYTVMFNQADPLNTIPQIKAIVDENQAGRHVQAKVPTYLYQAVNDELIYTPDLDALDTAQCAAGVPIDYDRDLLSDHVSLAITGAPAAISFVQQTLTGGRSTTGCSTHTTTTLLSPSAGLATLEFVLGLPRVFG